MRARLALLLALALPVAAGDAPRLQAAREEGSTALRVQVEGGSLPEQAVLSLVIERILPGNPPACLGRFRLVLGPGGRGEALYRIGEELAVPGSYRVRTSYEALGQYPAVLKALGGSKPPPAEILLDEDLRGKPYLQALLDEQASLASALCWTEGFLDDLGRMDALIAQDPKTGLGAWKSWRAKAIPELEKILDRGKRQGQRFFPQTYSAFSSGFLFMGLFQMESRKFVAAQSGSGYHGTGLFRDRSTVEKKELAPFREMCLKEAGICRLTVIRALAKAAKENRKVDSDEMLTLWSSDPAAFEDPRWKSLMELAPLFRAWLEAKEEERDAKRQALEAKYAELETAFKAK